MGITKSMACCSTKEILYPEEDDKMGSPPKYAYPDPQLDEANFPRSNSETTTILAQSRIK